MSFDGIYLLTKKKLQDALAFRLSTVAFFVKPLLWLMVFLFLRQNKLYIELLQGNALYVDFLVLGIAIWRIVTHVMTGLSYSVRSEMQFLKPILNAPSGEKTLFWSSILSNWIVAILIGIIVIAVGNWVYGFMVYYHYLLLALFVVFLVILVHTGIALFFLAFSFKIKDIASLSFLLTTLFGLLSGVFFPATYFPAPLNTLAFILPMTQGIYLLQSMLLFPFAAISWKLFWALFAEAFILFFVGKYLYEHKVRELISK